MEFPHRNKNNYTTSRHATSSVHFDFVQIRCAHLFPAVTKRPSQYAITLVDVLLNIGKEITFLVHSTKPLQRVPSCTTQSSLGLRKLGEFP